MAALPTKIRPGDLISSLGFIFDVTGAAIDPSAGANFNRIVLNQNPAGETLVAPDTPVNLVVSQTAVATSPPPTITRTETITGTATTSFPVNGSLVIVGTNFNATASQNIVTFDNVAATVTSDAADPTRRLIVGIPAGIPGAPVNSGDPARPGVVLSVRKTGGEPVTTTVTLTAPVAGMPTIGSVDNASPFEGTNITITGTNFTPAAQVLIRGQIATIVGTPTSTTIVATVPNFVDITPGTPVPVSLAVNIPTVGATTFNGTFRVRGI